MIDAGHGWGDINGYTIEQIKMFLESAIRQKNREIERLTWAIHVATQGEYKDVKKYTDTLAPEKTFGAEELLKDFNDRRKS